MSNVVFIQYNSDTDEEIDIESIDSPSLFNISENNTNIHNENCDPNTLLFPQLEIKASKNDSSSKNKNYPKKLNGTDVTIESPTVHNVTSSNVKRNVNKSNKRIINKLTDIVHLHDEKKKSIIKKKNITINGTSKIKSTQAPKIYKIIKVVLNKNIVENYLKNNRATQTRCFSTFDNENSERVNKKKQKQASILNYFSVKNKDDTGNRFNGSNIDAAEEGKDAPEEPVSNLSMTECESDKNAEVKCSECGKTFQDPDHLKLHKAICGLISQFECKFCTKKISTPSNLRKHIRRMHPEKLKNADSPDITQKTRKNADSPDIPQKTRKNADSPDITQKTRKNADSPDITQKTRKNDNSPDITQKTRKKSRALEDNAQQSASKEKEIPKVESKKPKDVLYISSKVKHYCSKCKKTFKKIIKPGRRSDDKCQNCGTSLQVQCVKCKKLFKAYLNAWNHVNTVCDPREILHCDDCDYTASVKSKMNEHIQRMHKEIDPKDLVRCPKCDKGFKLMHNMRNHEAYCGKSNDLECKYCSYKTKHKYYLTKHMKKHVLHLKVSNTKNDHSRVNKTSKDNKKLIKVIPHTPTIQIRNMFATAAVQYCRNCEVTTKVTNASNSDNCSKCKKKMVFKCNDCQRCYESSSGFSLHLKTKCAMPTSFHCDQCDNKYTIKDNLRRHIFAEHVDKVDENGLVACDKCGNQFKGRPNMLKHRRICGLGAFLKCKFCNFKTKYKPNLRKHILQFHDDVNKSKVEQILDEILKQARQKIKEKNKPPGKENNESGRKLEKPKKDINTKLEAIPIIVNGMKVISIRMSKEEKLAAMHLIEYYCRKCDKSASYQEFVPKRCSVCHTKRFLRCRKCSKQSVSLDKLKIHIKSEHMLAEHQRRLHQCVECGKRFNFIENLRYHWEVCLQSTPNFHCDDCDFATKTKKTLTNHIRRLHLGIDMSKKHLCKKCGLKFLSIEYLEKHSKSDTCRDASIYKCDQCGAIFRSQHKLTEHIKSKIVKQ